MKRYSVTIDIIVPIFWDRSTVVRYMEKITASEIPFDTYFVCTNGNVTQVKENDNL